MNPIREVHEEAMDLAEEADRAKKHGNIDEAQALYRRALVLETQAANETPFDLEPTRSILYRSAATLALDCGLEREAEQLANKGLAGTPPADIADELRDVIEQAQKHSLATEAPKTVFISYRHSVASFIARAVFQDLRANGYDVFMDVESIGPGDKFETILWRQIEARAHFLVILTPGTIERFAQPDDWLRREIEYAMDTKRNIVPLLVNDFTFNGSEQYLTGKLSQLHRYNGLEVPHTYFEEAMKRLRARYLRQPLQGVIAPAPAKDEPVVQQKIAEVIAQPLPTERELNAENDLNLAAVPLLYHSTDFHKAIEDFDKADSIYKELERRLRA